MSKSRASFEELYRANQKRAEEEQEQQGRKNADPASGTLMLSEPADPQLYQGGDLGLPDEPPPDLGSFGTLFQKKKPDLGGLADPNQSAGANPYDTQAGSRPRLAGKIKPR